MNPGAPLPPVANFFSAASVLLNQACICWDDLLRQAIVHFPLCGGAPTSPAAEKRTAADIASGFKNLLARDKIEQVKADAKELILRAAKGLNEENPRKTVQHLTDCIADNISNGDRVDVLESIAIALWCFINLDVKKCLETKGVMGDDVKKELGTKLDNAIAKHVLKTGPKYYHLHFLLKVASSGVQIFETTNGVTWSFFTNITADVVQILLSAGVIAAAAHLADYSTVTTESEIARKNSCLV